MLHKLIATLRKRGAHGRTFPVQATEATQAAEIIAGVVAQRDALREALNEMLAAHAIPSTVCKERPAYEKARAAIAKATD